SRTKKKDRTEMEDIAEFVKKYLLEHWPFFMVSFSIGLVGQFAKKRLWTETRALPDLSAESQTAEKIRQWFFFWMRASLPIHPLAAGASFGVILTSIYGDAAPASPGVTGSGAVVLYYMGAGAFSVIVYNAVKQFAKTRGLVNDELDPESS